MGRNSVLPYIRQSVCLKGSNSQLKGCECQLEGSEGQLEGSQGLPVGSEGLPEVPEARLGGPEGLPGGPARRVSGPARRVSGPFRGTLMMDRQTDKWTDRISPHSTGIFPLLGPLPKKKCETLKMVLMIKFENVK